MATSEDLQQEMFSKSSNTEKKKPTLTPGVEKMGWEDRREIGPYQ